MTSSTSSHIARMWPYGGRDKHLSALQFWPLWRRLLANHQRNQALSLFFWHPFALQFWTLRTRLANPASASMVPVASRDRALVNRRQTHRLLASQQPIGEQFTDTLRLNMVALNPIEDVTRMEATRPPQCHPVTYHCIFNTAGEDDFPAPQQILGS